MSIAASRIGSRWERYADVLAEGLMNYPRDFGDKDTRFMKDMADKFSTYKESTNVSTTQLNWLNRIEQAVIDRRSGLSRTGPRG